MFPKKNIHVKNSGINLKENFYMLFLGFVYLSVHTLIISITSGDKSRLVELQKDEMNYIIRV